jgi:hypothetical protein
MFEGDCSMADLLQDRLGGGSPHEGSRVFVCTRRDSSIVAIRSEDAEIRNGGSLSVSSWNPSHDQVQPRRRGRRNCRWKRGCLVGHALTFLVGAVAISMIRWTAGPLGTCRWTVRRSRRNSPLRCRSRNWVTTRAGQCIQRRERGGSAVALVLMRSHAARPAR